MNAILKPLSEFIKEKHIITEEDLEIAYRRGYFHGYSSSNDDVKKHGYAKSVDFENGKLSKWRYANKPKLFEFPPEM